MDMILKALKGINVDAIIERHTKRVTKEHSVLVNPEDINMFGDWEPRYEVIGGKPPPRRIILRPKYMLLIHLIIERCGNNSDNKAYFLTADYIPIFGRQFSEMLYTLEDMGIISIGYYQVGINSRPICLHNWAVEELTTTNKAILQMAKKVDKLTRRKKKERAQIIPKDDFTNNYNTSLSLIRLEREDEAINYINDNIEKDTFRYQYYMNRIKNFNKEENRITKIDKNGRLYHYLTNYPKGLKKYLNLRYQLDVHNSHPLIVNHYLLKYYNISFELIDKIININKVIIYDHNECKQLMKELKYNKLWKDDVRDIPCDVLLYIYITSKGVLWDMLSEMTHVDRDILKGCFFKEIFYGYNKTTRGKVFGKKFVELFPHVWSILRKIKKMDVGLPNTMMQHEAQMMKEILCRLYERGFKVASIHDAVIVPEDAANDGFDVDSTVQLMEEVYNKYGLIPSIEVKDYKEGL